MRRWRELKELPASNWAIFLACFANRLGTMVIPFLALYLTSERGFAVTDVGLLLSLYGLVALLVGPVAGAAADRFGAWPLMLASLSAFAIVVFLYPLAVSPLQIALATVCLALSNEVFRPVALTAVIEDCRPEHRRAAYALNRLGINLGMSIGPALGGILAAKSFALLFWVDGLTSLLAAAILLCYLLVKPKARSAQPPTRAAFNAKGLLAPLADRRLAYLLFSFLPLWFIFFQHESTMSLFVTRDVGLSPRTYGMLFTINTALIILFEIQLNLWTSGWSQRRVLMLGALCFAFGFGMMAFVSSPLGLGISVAIWTVGEMLLLPAAAAYISDLAPPEKRGAYLGTYHSSFSFVFIFAPWLGTVLLERGGGIALWGTCFAAGLLSTVLFVRIKESSSRNEHPAGTAHA